MKHAKSSASTGRLASRFLINDSCSLSNAGFPLVGSFWLFPKTFWFTKISSFSFRILLGVALNLLEALSLHLLQDAQRTWTAFCSSQTLPLFCLKRRSSVFLSASVISSSVISCPFSSTLHSHLWLRILTSRTQCFLDVNLLLRTHAAAVSSSGSSSCTSGLPSSSINLGGSTRTLPFQKRCATVTRTALPALHTSAAQKAVAVGGWQRPRLPGILPKRHHLTAARKWQWVMRFEGRTLELRFAFERQQITWRPIVAACPACGPISVV